MSAPSKANIIKLDNPAHVMVGLSRRAAEPVIFTNF